MKTALIALAVAAGLVGAVRPASADLVTILLNTAGLAVPSGTTILPPGIVYDIDDGLGIGDLLISPGPAAEDRLRVWPQGLGVCNPAACPTGEHAVDNLAGNGTSDWILFSLPDAPTFNFTLVSATFGWLQDGYEDVVITYSDPVTGLPTTYFIDNIGPGIEFVDFPGDGLFGRNFQFGVPDRCSPHCNDAYKLNQVVWEIQPVPEPATVTLLGLGLAGLGMMARRRVTR